MLAWFFRSNISSFSAPSIGVQFWAEDLKKRLEQLLYAKAEELSATIHALEIEPDHVRMVVESAPTLAPAHLAAQFKGHTSRVLREEFAWLKSRLPSLWSRRYYIGSVGQVAEPTVRKYIENQTGK